MRQELLSHEIIVEDMGGETQDVEVSATKKTGLDKLEEAILLQAEMLDLRANPDRSAEGTVIESRLDRGRGPVATVLVQKGTLYQGDIVVAGAEWGRVRAMLDDKGQHAEGGRSRPRRWKSSAWPACLRPASRSLRSRTRRGRARSASSVSARSATRPPARPSRPRHARSDARPHPGRRAEGSRRR